MPVMETVKSSAPTRNDKGNGIKQTINWGKEKQKVKEGESHEPKPAGHLEDDGTANPPGPVNTEQRPGKAKHQSCSRPQSEGQGRLE